MKAYFFTCGRENLGLSPGLKLGMMFPWPVRPICSHSAFPETRGAKRKSDARCEFSVLGGRQDIFSAQTCGASSSENPSEQDFWVPQPPQKAVGPIWQHGCQQPHGWVMGSPWMSCAGSRGMSHQHRFLLRQPGAATRASVHP